MFDIKARHANMLHKINKIQSHNITSVVLHKMQNMQKAVLPKSKKKHPASAKLQTYQKPKEIKEIAPENINSPKKDCYDLTDLLACLEKTRAHLAKSERILKETPAVSEQLRKNSQSDLSNVAETLQNVSKQLLEHFTRPDYSVTVGKPNNETSHSTGEPGLAKTSGRDVPNRPASGSESCPAESPKLSQQQQEQHLETRNGKPVRPPSVSNARKHENSLPKARFGPPSGTKERSHPNFVELNKLLPGLRAPVCKVKTQGGQGSPTSANQNTVTCSGTARSSSDKVPLVRRQNRASFSDIFGTSEDLMRANQKSNDIYLPMIPERVPVHQNHLTRSIRLKQDHNMRELFGL